MFSVLEDRPCVTLLGLLESSTASTEHGRRGRGGGFLMNVGGWDEVVQGVQGPGSADTGQ